MYGNNGNDWMSGDNGNDWMSGDAGNDRMYGGGGNDTVYGGDGNDVMSGGTGNDWMRGGNHDDIMNGDDGNDCLFGDAGSDDLNGGKGDDKLDGGTGSDFLWGGENNDQLTGGEGKDVFEVHLKWNGAVFTSTDGTDTVHDFDMDNDADVLTFVIDDTTGAANATALFAALDAATSVFDNTIDTVIGVGGATIKLLGVHADHPFNFNELSDINDYSDGNYLYEAVDIVIV